MDAADNWIAERAGQGDIVVTADVPLAGRCVKAGAAVIAPNGKAFNEDSIGMTLATRNLLPTCAARARSPAGRTVRPARPLAFLSALDLAAVRFKRAGFGKKI